MTTSNPIQIILNENKTNSPMVNIDILNLSDLWRSEILR